MSKRQTFSSYMAAIAKQQAREQREAEKQRLREEKQRISRERELAAHLVKADKQKYLEARIAEAEAKNEELAGVLQQLRCILEHTLSVDDKIEFDSLLVAESYPEFIAPQRLTIPNREPQKYDFFRDLKELTFLEKALSMKGRYNREWEAADQRFRKALADYAQAEAERKAKLRELREEYDKGKAAFTLKVEQRKAEVEELKAKYSEAEPSAIMTYCSMVLERSQYPEGFPQSFRVAFVPESRELVVEYQLPDVSIVPTVEGCKYVKSKDIIEEKPAKPASIKSLYQDVVASVAIRTLHELFEADQGAHLDLAVFNGYVETVDPATGKDIRPYLISVRVSQERFAELNLARIDKKACLRNLGAQVSPQPEEMQAVKPIVEFNMVDKRFIEGRDVLSDLESRPNLMELSPSEFEALVSNLFDKHGLEAKLTRSSRDGGVDVVAFDTRPVLGGKVVIQAKRYKNTVGVSAVRDLYGTMINEGANKGILVATSSYGKDAYEFSKDKPIELIDGGGLLYLLEQVGIRARIVMPIEGQQG